MHLKNIVITGADHTISVEMLLAAMQRTSHVDFGILFSPSRPKLRYPNTAWLERLTTAYTEHQTTMQSSLYAHICGAWITSLLKGEDTFFQENEVCHGASGKYFTAFDGFQLNIGRRSIEDEDIKNFISILKKTGLDRREWIIQIQVKRQNDFVAALRKEGINANPLYDKSGGKGVEPKSWIAPQLDGYIGYAGGLTPENWFSVAQILSAHPHEQPFWLDMESGVRTPDEHESFDLAKVTQIIEHVCILEANNQLFGVSF